MFPEEKKILALLVTENCQAGINLEFIFREFREGLISMRGW